MHQSGEHYLNQSIENTREPSQESQSELMNRGQTQAPQRVFDHSTIGLSAEYLQLVNSTTTSCFSGESVADDLQIANDLTDYQMDVIKAIYLDDYLTLLRLGIAGPSLSCQIPDSLIERDAIQPVVNQDGSPRSPLPS